MIADNHNLILGLAIIAAIVIIYISGVVTEQPTDIAVLTGLIGILGTFTRKAAPTSNVERAGTVNQSTEGERP